MLAFPNCKINIGLHVVRRREDGFHDLETVFYPVPFKDALEILPTQNAATFHQTGKKIDGDACENLVLKAFHLLQNLFPEKVHPLDIHLHKNIPTGAGLGGGSANAAFMLRMMNDFFSLKMEETTLLQHAEMLGSDCPFFIRKTPQFATGKGTELTHIPLDLSGYRFQLVLPDVHISTAKAFQSLHPKTPSFNLQKLPELPVAEWKNLVVNDFETPVFAQHPELADLKKQLYGGGALYASLTGSGAALYGIFQKGMKADIRAKGFELSLFSF